MIVVWCTDEPLYECLSISQSKQYIEINTVLKTNNRKIEILKRKKKKFVIFYFIHFKQLKTFFVSASVVP